LTFRGESRHSLGNLVAGRDLIVSMGRAEIAVFPQAERELERLRSQSHEPVRDPNRLLEIAELELILGRLDSAEPRLEDVLRRTSATLAADRANGLLREALRRRLAEGEVRSTGDLVRLAKLSQSPEHFGKYLLALQHARGETNELAVALAAAREFSLRTPDEPYRVGDDPSREVTGLVLASGAGPSTVRAVETKTTEAIEQAVQARDAPALRRLARLLADRSQADEARIKLAQLLIADQKFQQAETVLLECRESPQEAIAGRSTRMLAELWNSRGLCHDAARLFVELAGRFADVEVAEGLCGRTWLAVRFGDDSTMDPYPTAQKPPKGGTPTGPAFEAYRRMSRPEWSGVEARIVERPTDNEELHAIYSGNGVQLLPTPRQSAFDLFDRGRGANGIYSVVNRHTGEVYPETIQVPGRLFYPVSIHVSAQYLQHAYVGNFLPLGGVGALHGVSLLERKLLWTTAPPALKDVREVVKVGPAGPGFCTFQLRQHLFVVDPLDGHLLWHRDDLEGTAGLMHEPFRGIIGDERVLTVFATNGANYTVYDTATGAELRRGKIDVQTRQQPRVLGRRLFHYTASAQQRRVRVWDPLTDCCTWDESADTIAEASILEGVAPGTKVFAFVRETDEAAYVTTAGTIRVVDLLTGKEVFDLAVAPEHLENISALRAFRDRERYFFNVQRSMPPAKPPVAANAGLAVTDAPLSAVHIDGDLLAVDAPNRRLMWRRSLGKRTILQLPDLSLPVLVSLSRTRRDDKSYLAVEVVDVLSGETLAVREDLPFDKPLQTAYDRHGPSIELRGHKSVIRMEFPTIIGRADSTAQK
jgi:hypothetical protein